MSMVTEDYISLDIAKMLKEKGFDEVCVGYYVDDNSKEILHSYCGESNSTWEERCCSAPTLQMVMKWLREIHEIFISIQMHMDGSYVWYVYDTTYASIKGCDRETHKHSYEQACEAAIKYCLEKLL